MTTILIILGVIILIGGAYLTIKKYRNRAE